MSEQRDLIVDTAERLFGDLVDKAMLDSAERGEWQQGLHASLVENGFHELGGAESGTGADELFAFLEVAGQHAAPLPLADTLLANAWLGAVAGASGMGEVDGDVVRDVPWGRAVQRVVGITPGSRELLVINAPQVVRQGANMAGEPRDDVALATDAERLQAPVDPQLWLALSRVALMAGGLRSALAQAIRYATEREQFGRPISKFQAIQHTLAVMAAEVAAAGRAADAAVSAVGSAREEVELAAARSRCGEAVAVVAEAAHQVHGAIGFTHEHRLHHTTRRLWAWRDEFGNEVVWQRRLGAVVVGQGADGVWDFVTSGR